MQLQNQSQFNRAIAVSVSCAALLVWVIRLSVSTPITQADSHKTKAESAPPNDAPAAEMPPLESLVSFIGHSSDQFFDVMASHQHGMCGGRHFFRFSYMTDADLQSILATNLPSTDQLADRSWQALVRPSEPTEFDSGMGPLTGMGAGSLNGNSSMTGATDIPEWFSIPTTAKSYFGRKAFGWQYLSVDAAARVGYLEVSYGIP